MAKSWREVRAQAADAGLLNEERVREHRDHLESEIRAYQLGEVRKAQHQTQAQIAQAMGVSQPRVSKLERGELERTELATLRAYVEALGGKLRVVADFGDQHITVG